MPLCGLSSAEKGREWKEKERKNRCGYEKKANNQFQTG